MAIFARTSLQSTRSKLLGRIPAGTGNQVFIQLTPSSDFVGSVTLYEDTGPSPGATLTALAYADAVTGAAPGAGYPVLANLGSNSAAPAGRTVLVTSSVDIYATSTITSGLVDVKLLQAPSAAAVIPTSTPLSTLTIDSIPLWMEETLAFQLELSQSQQNNT